MITKPIFIIGNIRSGTTILYNLLATHREVCWYSNHTNRFPRIGALAATHRLMGVPYIGDAQRRALTRSRSMVSGLRGVPWPDEGDDIYHSYCGLGSDRDGVETTLTEAMENKLKKTIRNHLTFSGKRRFLNKQTANIRRLDLMNRVFPDAYYIHCIRDGRAVANSTLRMSWWNDLYIWWLGQTVSQWAETGRDPIELCALYWKRNVEEVQNNRTLFEGRYIEVRYEELTRDTHGVLRRLVDFCELNGPDKFINLLPAQLPNMNHQWGEQLTEEQKSLLHDSIGEFLSKLGYLRA